MEEYLRLDTACEIKSFKRSMEKQRFLIKDSSKRRSLIKTTKNRKINDSDALQSSRSIIRNKLEKKIIGKSTKNLLKQPLFKTLKATYSSYSTPNNSVENSPIFQSVNSYYNIEEDAII